MGIRALRQYIYNADQRSSADSSSIGNNITTTVESTLNLLQHKNGPKPENKSGLAYDNNSSEVMLITVIIEFMAAYAFILKSRFRGLLLQVRCYIIYVLCLFILYGNICAYSFSQAYVVLYDMLTYTL